MSTAVRPASVRPRHTLRWALLISLAVHAVVLSVRFIHPQAFNDLFQAKTLDIVLINARSDEKPLHAQALAQHNLAGGGQAAKHKRASTPLPPMPAERAGEAAVAQNRRTVEELQRRQRILLEQVRAQLAVLPAESSQHTTNAKKGDAAEGRRPQLTRLLAAIERRIEEENARPHVRYLSPATVGVTYALYYDAMRRRIEEVGTRDFPNHDGQKLYGKLFMSLLVNNDGKLLDTHVVRSSGDAVLDRQAQAIAQHAAPFGPFTPAMRRDTEQFDITLAFRFTHQAKLETGTQESDAAQPAPETRATP